MQNRRQGFTLIELLVVIAIIAILAAILFPVFAKVREKARQTSCVSNMKQIGLAFEQYTQDYDEMLPECNAGAPPSASLGYPHGWAGKLYPYTKSTALFTCPDDSAADVAGKNLVSYALNWNLQYVGGTFNGGSRNTGIENAAHHNAPASTVLLMEWHGSHAKLTDPYETDSVATGLECGQNGNGGHWVGGPLDDASFGCHDQKSAPEGVHTGGSNFLALDGHVKFLRTGKISWGYRDPTDPNAAQGSDVASGTGAMNNGGGQGSAALTFSAI